MERDFELEDVYEKQDSRIGHREEEVGTSNRQSRDSPEEDNRENDQEVEVSVRNWVNRIEEETREKRSPERVNEADDRGIADAADDLRRPSVDQHADGAARKDAAGGRRRTDPIERTGASPNSATSSEGENRFRSSGSTITSGSRKGFGSSEKMGN